MKRLIISAGLLLGLSGCATYDYVGGGAGGYYHGSPSVQRSYPYGYPYGGSYGGYYGYGSGYYGYGDYGYGYGGRYPVYRPPHNHRPPHNGHGNGHRPGHGGNHGNGPRPPHGQGTSRPTPSTPSLPPVNSGGSKSPWRDMDRLQRPQPSRPAASVQPMQRAAPRPQSAAPRQPMQSRPIPERQPSHNREDRAVRIEER